MFRQIIIAVAVAAFVQPLTANAQLLRNRKQKDSQPAVVNVYNPVVVPAYTPTYCLNNVVSYPVAPVFVAEEPVMRVSYSAPVITHQAAVAAAPANHLPIRTPAPAVVAAHPQGGAIRLSNPAENQGTLYFMLNEVTHALNPGEAKTISVDRDWVIKFDNGNQRQLVYRLTSGVYEFTVSPSTGWNIVKRSNDTQSVAVNDPAIPSNAIPTL